VNGLRAELARAGIRGRLARRIMLELDDHLRCDPEANVGPPREIAERFAEELRVPRTRRSTYAGFAALALTAVLLGVPTRGVSAAGGWPAVVGLRATIASLAGLTMALAGQVAVVAGVLALWASLMRSGAPEELRLIQRRLGIALAAGAVVLAGQAVQGAALAPLLPAWWFAVALPAVLVPGLAIGGAARGLSGAVAVTPVVEPARRGFPPSLVVAIGVGVVALIGIGSTFSEHSMAEGATRAVLEAVAFGAGFLFLGRRLGIRR
jgi:hypothetical protein